MGLKPGFVGGFIGVPVLTFYLPSSGAAAISPTDDAGWEQVADGFIRAPLVTTKTATAMTTLNQTFVDSSAHDTIFGQWVSEPLAAQDIGAISYRLQMRCSESNSNNNLFLSLCLRVLSNDGSVVRGTLLTITSGATELALTTLTNRRVSGTLSALAGVVSGDRLVLEVGNSGDPGLGNHNSDHRVGDSGGGDLPNDETSTSDLDPYIVFGSPIYMAA